MDILRPGEGPELCIEVLASGQRCGHHEVEGLEYCVWHMPDEFLEEAEEITGWRRCRRNFGDPDACHQAAVKGTKPPRCKNHGANSGSVIAKHAAANLVDGRQADRLVVILAEHGEKLLDPSPLGNPLMELMELGAEIKAFKELLRSVTAYLLGKDLSRYSNRYGEQVRAEILLYERAQERLAKVLMDIGKLGIEAKLAQIEAAQITMVERALDAGLEAATAGLPDHLERQESARTALRRALTAKAS